MKASQWFFQLLGTLRRSQYKRHSIPLEKSLIWEKDTFLTFHRREKYPSINQAPLTENPILIDLGVVIQGPIISRRSFTLETARWFRNTWPESKVVISTWEEDLTEEVLLRVPPGVDIVAQKKPDTTGPYNVNFQLRSALAGFKKLEEMDVKLALKVRSDQRIGDSHAPYLLEFLRSTASSRFHSRLVVLSANSFVNRLFGLSDFLVYGELRDQLELWGVAEVDAIDLKKLPGAIMQVSPTPESYIWSEYAKRIGFQAHNWGDFKSFVSQKIAIVDSSSIDWSWQKYSRREYPYRKPGFHLREMSNSRWIELLGKKDAGDL